MLRIEAAYGPNVLQSPKFSFIQEHLQSVFSISLLKEEWKKRVLSQLRKQLIFDPIEYRDINDSILDVIKKLNKDLVAGQYGVRRARRFLSEKSRGLCRQMTLVHPLDLLVLERVARAIYFELKDKAPSKSAYFEPDDGNFVKGFKQEDFEYGSYASWRKFQKKVFGFAEENNFIVVTDVANFYDFINFQHLRNIVASLADIRESILDFLIYMLNRLTWTPDFMPLTQVGMPQIETTATRVLANAMLYEVDRVCEKAVISNYARFMDDMDIGVNSIAGAKCIIRDVDLTLQSRQLRLNSSKTKILTKRDAFHHFCIKENIELARIEKIMEKKPDSKLVKSILMSRYTRWLSRSVSGAPGAKSRFIQGNGPKIHKYTLRLIYESGQSVPRKDLLWLVKNDPTMRVYALRYLARSKFSNSNVYDIKEMIMSGVFVDDEALVSISGYLLHSRFSKSIKLVEAVRDICKFFIKFSDIGLHSSIFVATKFLPRKEVLGILVESKMRISGDYWLGRAAGGVSSVFWDTPEWKEYTVFLDEIDSKDAFDVFKYVTGVIYASSFSSSLKSYLKAQNGTYPQGLFFPKVLLLLAAHKNKKVSSLFPLMHTTHPSLREDPFFRAMGF